MKTTFNPGVCLQTSLWRVGADFDRCGVAPRSQIHEGYAPSSRLASFQNHPPTLPKVGLQTDPSRSTSSSGFSLPELLIVVAIVGLMSVAAIPALNALSSAGAINRAVTDVSGAVEMARGYAMSHHTYVRVAMGTVPASSSRLTPVLVVLVMAPSDGTLDASTKTDMQDLTKWLTLFPPLRIDNIALNDNLGLATDDKPSSSNIEKFTRTVSDLGSVQFTSFIQYNPSGEARTQLSEPSRFIKIGVDKPSPQDGKNPFVVRISGSNGTVSILRKGNGI